MAQARTPPFRSFGCRACFERTCGFSGWVVTEALTAAPCRPSRPASGRSARAWSTDWRPAMAALISCETLVPRSVNSGMPTNWIPAAGRGWVPGFSGLALAMAFSVMSAKAPAALRYSGLA